MALTDNKITVYADNVSDLSDTPNADGLTADQLKAFLDSRGDNEIKESVNGICDDLTATADGASGADQIGATALTGGTATTTQGIMEELDGKIKAIPAAEETYTNKTLTAPKINEDVVLTSTATELNKLHGATASTEEINWLKGVTSAIQAQLNGTVKTTGSQTVAGVKTFLDEVHVGSDGIIREDVNSFEIVGGTAGDTLIFNAGDLTFNGAKVWNSANDGTGSGLDADKLDGVDGNGYVNTTTNQTVAGIKTFSSSPVVPTPTTDMQASTKKYADDLALLKVSKAGDTMIGALAMGANKITGLANPTENTDAVNFQTLQSQLAALHNLDVIGSTSISAVAEDLDANKMPTASGNAKSITAIETLIGEYVPVEKDSVLVTYLMTGVEEKYQFLYEYSGTAWTVATPTFSVTMANGATAGIVEGASGDAGDIVVTSGIMTLKDASVLTTPLTGYQVAATAADIAATDTINEAFGKAQKQIDVVDTNIGNLTYTEDNYVTDGESVTASIDALDMQAKDTADLVSTNRTSELKSISTIDITPTDYLAHLYTVTGYAQNQAMPNNADGKALLSIKGLTATNIVSGESVANGDSVSFASVTGNKYYDTLNNAILTGTGSTMTATNSSGATKSMMIIDLNALGFQAKTTGELAIIFPYYFDGTRSTLAGMRLFGRGKNLFDKNGKILLGKTFDASGNVTTSSASNISDFIKVKSGQTYFLSNADPANGRRTVYYDSNRNIISVVTGLNNVQLSTPNNVVELRFSFDSTKTDLIQLELGSVSTPYEPYTYSTAYTPQGTLRSVPSASDEVYMGEDGNVRKVQRVSDDYALVAGDITGPIFSDSGLGISIFATVSFAGYKGGTSGVLTGNYILQGYPEQANSSGSTMTTANIGFSYNADSSTAIRIVMAYGTTLAQAQSALSGKILNYELATPITTELEVIGNLQACPNGSILAEPCYSGYVTGATTIIGTASLPIKAINKVESISLDTNGNAVRTDVTASCSVDTTTLTITGYDASNVYFYDLDIDTKYTTTGLKTYQVECPTGIVTHDFLAGATAWTLTANENKANYLKGINAGGAANVVLQPIDGKLRVYQNASGQTQTLKTASSTGVTVLNGKTATFAYMGTDFIKLSEV